MDAQRVREYEKCADLDKRNEKLERVAEAARRVARQPTPQLTYRDLDGNVLVSVVAETVDALRSALSGLDKEEPEETHGRA